MHRDIIKGNSKVIMRRVKQQWGNFTDEEIAQIQGFYDDQRQELKHQYRLHREHLKALKN